MVFVGFGETKNFRKLINNETNPNFNAKDKFIVLIFALTNDQNMRTRLQKAMKISRYKSLFE
jgi:hypothetical protein